MIRVAIIDTGLCNLDSIARAIEECGGDAAVTSDPETLRAASRIVLPGVGAFPEAMARLAARGFADELQRQVVDGGIPFLGICLGMQLLASEGVEVRPTRGLGLIPGAVTRLEPRPGERVPHIGWNSVEPADGCELFAGIEPGRDFYFVHSYALRPTRAGDVAATTDYAGGFVSAVASGNVFGVQFHPEKSQRVGFAVLRNFLSLRD